MKGTPMSVPGAGKTIRSEVIQWEGVTTGSHRFDGTEFKLDKREIGHVHGDSLVDVPLPKGIRDELVAAAQAEPHHVLPESGWVSVYLHESNDVDRAIGILRRSFEIARAQLDRRTAKSASTSTTGEQTIG
jgi:hypothetical protein